MDQKLSNQSLAGQVALVTGAAKGLGAEIARQLGRSGAAVIVNYAADELGAGKVVEDIVASGGRAAAIQADLSHPEEVERLFTECDRLYGGRLDILVNNAGIYYSTPLHEMTAAQFHHMFDINVLGLLLASKAAATRFADRGGRIINITSVATVKGFAGTLVYSASKGAVDAATRVLATELAPKNVRVNAISPGLIITEGTHAAGMTSGDYRAMWESLSPLGRAALPADIAPIVEFLVSPQSGWLTGEIFYATGGVR